MSSVLLFFLFSTLTSTALIAIGIMAAISQLMYVHMTTTLYYTMLNDGARTERHALESPLIRLPVEIRLQIYEQVIAVGAFKAKFRVPPIAPFPHFRPRLHGLLCVSRQLNAETAALTLQEAQDRLQNSSQDKSWNMRQGRLCRVYCVEFTV